MNKFRASYTVLSLWASGRWEQAVETYFKLDRFVTPEMAEGKEYHKEWESYISKKKRLPDIFGGKKLLNPQTELKLTAQIYPWLELVGVIDAYDKNILYEFKTGGTSASTYTNAFQLSIYAVLGTLNDLYLEKAELHVYNQYTKQADMSLVHITDKTLESGLNYIETLSGEMHEYFLKNDYYQRYGQFRNDD